MGIFDILTMIGGLAFFLYGMDTMGKGLALVSGGKLERVLERLTKDPLKAVLLGAAVTAVIQSSSATTVMVVGFVNSGLMKLGQAAGVIMGANIGTTVTSWLLSLSGIESGNFFIRLLKPSSFAPALAMAGVCLRMFSGKEGRKDTGIILIGFAILMAGMETMSQAVKPLAEAPGFTRILTLFSHPVPGVVCGALLTAVLQSSSASVGILQALCATGEISFGMAVPVIMGQNIGTCVTAVLSGIGAHKNAKRAALVHLYFNLIGTVLFMTGFYALHGLFRFAFMDGPAGAAGIAAVHSLFNLTAAAVLLPFSGLLVKLACLTIPEAAEDLEEEQERIQELKLLDVRFLDTPGYAVGQCRQAAVLMAGLCRKILRHALRLTEAFDKEAAEKVFRMEERVDRFEDELGSYLVKLGSRNLSERDSRTVSLLLHCLGDFERIADHAVNITQTAQELGRRKTAFSEKAKKELKIFSEALAEAAALAVDAFTEEDMEKAAKVEPLEETVDHLSRELKKRHVERLRSGECTIGLGVALSDMITDYERISDHCSNIALAVLQSGSGGYEAHEYAAGLYREETCAFRDMYHMYREKYGLPKDT